MLPQAFGAGTEDWFSCMAPGYHVPWPWAITVYFKRCLTNPNYTSGPHFDVFGHLYHLYYPIRTYFLKFDYFQLDFIESLNVDVFFVRISYQLKGPLTCHRLVRRGHWLVLFIAGCCALVGEAAKWFYTIRSLPQRKRFRKNYVMCQPHHTNIVSWKGCMIRMWLIESTGAKIAITTWRCLCYDQGIQVICMLAWVLSGGNADYGTGLRDSFWTLGLGACQKGLWVYIQVVTFVRGVCHLKAEFLEVNESTDVVGMID